MTKRSGRCFAVEEAVFIPDSILVYLTVMSHEAPSHAPLHPPRIYYMAV